MSERPASAKIVSEDLEHQLEIAILIHECAPFRCEPLYLHPLQDKFPLFNLRQAIRPI
jgi:hypothetical protein